MKKFTKLFVVFLVVALFAKVLHVTQFADAEEGTALATIQSCGFPRESEALLSYAAADAVWPELQNDPLQLTTPIPAGSYKINAHSFDPHTTKNDPTQPDERWQIWAYGTDLSTPIYTSGYTNDIPDNIDTNQTEIAQYVYFDQPVTAIRYVHYAYSNGLEDLQFGGAAFDDLTQEQKDQVTWQSVIPDCVDFEPVQTVTCTSLSAVAVQGVAGAYDFTVKLENTNTLDLETEYIFGDQTATVTTIDPVVRHVYAKAGTYTVRANVKLGTATVAECEATVRITSGSGAVLGATTGGTGSGTTNGSTSGSTGVLGASTTNSGASRQGGAVLGATTGK